MCWHEQYLAFHEQAFVGRDAKYKDYFDVSSEDRSFHVKSREISQIQTKVLRPKRRNSPYIFQVVASLPTKACSYYWHWPALALTVQDFSLPPSQNFAL